MSSATSSDVSRLPPIHNTYTPDISVDGDDSERVLSPSPSDTSDVGAPVPVVVSSSPNSVVAEESPMDFEEPQMTESSSGDDASDNDDGDFEAGHVSENHDDDDVLEIESSPEPLGRRNLSKPKVSKESAEDFSLDPELYGLRRSVSS